MELQRISFSQLQFYWKKLNKGAAFLVFIRFLICPAQIVSNETLANLEGIGSLLVYDNLTNNVLKNGSSCLIRINSSSNSVFNYRKTKQVLRA